MKIASVKKFEDAILNYLIIKTENMYVYTGKYIINFVIRVIEIKLPMKKKECPSCAMEIDSNATTCPICGYEFPTQNKIYTWVAILLLIVILMYFIF